MKLHKILLNLATFKLILTIFLIILFVLLFNQLIPTIVKSMAFTCSNIMRKILMFILPFLIFPYLVTSISNIKSKSTFLIVGIALLILLSNFISIMIAYFFGTTFIPFLGLSKIENFTGSAALEPLIDFSLNPFIDIETTMILSVIFGMTFSYYRNEKITNFFEKYMDFSSWFFQKIYIPIIPLYVLGTLLKVSYEIDLFTFLPIFGSMVIMILITQVTYIFFLFYVGAYYNFAKTFQSIKNASAAAIVGFSTMSSLVTMPLTIKAAEKNIDDGNIAKLIISSTVNCHDVGECISLPMIALTLYYLTYLSFPDLNIYCVFAFLAALAQFSGVSIPGGSVIIISPFLEKYLNFNPEMLSFIITISIFMDPIGTANNILGNNAFVMLIYRLYRKISKKNMSITSFDV